jgi:DNA sulfur modification protein DndC
MKEISEIRKRLREVNIVSFSGGKDSTSVLQLVLKAMRSLKPRDLKDKMLYIVTSDTLMEIPFYQQYVDRVREKIDSFVRAGGVNAEIVTVKPDLSLTFWVCVLGKGYPAAHMGFRWCTGVLKIDPITKFTQQITEGKDYTVFVGVRRAESERRAKIYTQRDYKPHHYAPILNWSNEEVWTYLLTEACPWGSHEDLVKVYRYSSDECVYGEKQGVCIGNARYGCWACPLQKSTQLGMIGYFTADPRYALLREYKEMLVSMANNTAFRSRIRRNGEEGAGPFLVEVRKDLYRALVALEEATGWQLITPEEEKAIFQYWEDEKDIHNVPDDSRPMLWEVGV